MRFIDYCNLVWVWSDIFSYFIHHKYENVFTVPLRYVSETYSIQQEFFISKVCIT